MEEIENFYGVYLLCSENDNLKYNSKNYIGYTVDPNRRIIQHNKGVEFGGAKTTNNKGPWKIILIVHGFPNNILALQFEWTWQHSKESRHLKNIQSLCRRKNSESYFEYNFRILCEMLGIGPWKQRLPLVIRWLSPEFVRSFPINQLPPMHMQISYDFICVKKKSKNNKLIIKNSDNNDNSNLCDICFEKIIDAAKSQIQCLNVKCHLICHTICLAKLCLNANDTNEYIPIEGDCPKCDVHFLWGDLIRKKCGIEYNMNDDDNEEKL